MSYIVGIPCENCSSERAITIRNPVRPFAGGLAPGLPALPRAARVRDPFRPRAHDVSLATLLRAVARPRRPDLGRGGRTRVSGRGAGLGRGVSGPDRNRRNVLGPGAVGRLPSRDRRIRDTFVTRHRTCVGRWNCGVCRSVMCVRAASSPAPRTDTRQNSLRVSYRRVMYS